MFFENAMNCVERAIGLVPTPHAIVRKLLVHDGARKSRQPSEGPMREERAGSFAYVANVPTQANKTATHLQRA